MKVATAGTCIRYVHQNELSQTMIFSNFRTEDGSHTTQIVAGGVEFARSYAGPVTRALPLS